jgi:hypothetical protein
MKKAIVILLQVLGTAVCSAQYFHFNRTYFEDNFDTTYAFSHVAIIDEFIYAQGVGIASSINMKSNIKFNMDGDIIAIYDHENLTPDDRPTRNETLFTNDSVYIICPDRYSNCLNQMPTMTCFTLQNEVIWEKDFIEWEDCDQEMYINARKLLRISDTSFVFISLMRPYQENYLSQFRFTEMNFDGDILNDYISNSPLWIGFSFTEAYRYADNYILVGSGVVLGDTCIGNPSDCPDGRAGTLLNEDGTLQLVYSKCIENFDVNEQTHEMRSLKLNISDWSIIYDYPIAFPVFDAGLLSSAAGFTDFINDPNGGYIGLFYYYNSSAAIGFQNCVIKLESNGNLDWINLYFSPIGFNHSGLVDISCTPDGGYVAAGSSAGFDQDVYVERAWLLKIDACGYEQPSGCPEVVGIEGDGRHPKPVEGSFPVWPNPFHTQLKAVLPPTATRVFISDATGRIVFEENIYYPRQEWNLSMLSDGVYVMSVELESGMMVSERIVKR